MEPGNTHSAVNDSNTDTVINDFDDFDDDSISENSETEFQQTYKFNIDAMMQLKLSMHKGPHNEEASFLSHQTDSSKQSIILDNTNSMQQTSEGQSNE